MAETNFTPVELIRATLEVYDPQNLGIIIGTSALHWAIEARVSCAVKIPFTDVDLFASIEDVDAIHRRLPDEMCGDITLNDGRLTVDPSIAARRIGVSILDVMSGGDSYDDALVRTHSNSRVYVRDTDIDVHVIEDNRNYLSLPFTCWWKAATGRPTDFKTLQALLITMLESGLFSVNEFHSVAQAIEYGKTGYDFYGNPIPSDDYE